MTTDKKLIARVTALVQRFLELIEIIRHDVRTRTAPNSLKLEGDDKERVLELAKEGMLVEETLKITLDGITSIFDDASFILRGGNPLNLKATLEGNIFSEPNTVFTGGATNGKGAWIVTRKSGGIVNSTNGGTSFMRSYGIEELFVDVIYETGKFYLLHSSGAVSIIDETTWSLSTIRTSEGRGGHTLRVYEENKLVVFSTGRCFIVNVTDGSVDEIDLDGVRLAEILIDGRAVVVNMAGGVMITEDAFDLSVNKWLPIGDLGSTPVSMSSDIAGYFAVLTDTGIYVYDIAKSEWKFTMPEIEHGLNSIYMDNRGMIVCSTDGGWLVRSVDYGLSWSPVMTDTDANLLSIFGGIRPEGSSVLCVVGESKYIAISS